MRHRGIKMETFSYTTPSHPPPEAIEIKMENGCDWYMFGKRGYQDFNARASYEFGVIGERTVVVEVRRY
jgi:hypothetical protein